MKSINESQSEDLLLNMYNFYKTRYASNQTEMETKFNNAVEDLISTGDIDKKEYVSFCVTHNVEPRIKAKKTTSSSISSSSSSYSVDPCGGGGRTTRSSC